VNPVVYAANYGGFGSTYSEVISPKDAVLNDETAKSEDVKSGLTKIVTYKQAISDIKSELVKYDIIQLLDS
jgi:hypothetical protein